MSLSLRLVTLALVLGVTNAGSLGLAPAPSTGIRGWIESIYNWGFGAAQTAAATVPEQRSIVYEEHTYVDMPSKGVTLVDHGFPIVTMCPVNVVFVLDGSDSVSPQGFDEARAYLKSAIRNVTDMYEGTDVGVIMFSNGISEEIALRSRDQYQLQQLYQQIDGLVQPRRETELHTTLERARSILSSYAPSEGKVIVLISDGCPNNVALSQMQAKNAWSEGIYILSIAIEKAQVNMLKKLSVRIQNILTPIKWKYTVACPPSNLPQVPGNLGCSDIMIVMDGSDSACKHKDVIKNYLVNLPLRFTSIPNYMGVVVYGTDVDSVIPLTQNKQTLSSRIQAELRFPATGTATAKGIEEAILNLQRSGTSSSQAMILITDGPPINAQLAAAATRRAMNYGIKVLVIGVGNHLQNYELLELAGGVQENVYRVDSFMDLYTVDYTTNICSVPSTPTCNTRCINGRNELVNDRCICTCQTGYSGAACDIQDPVCDACANGGRKRSSNPNDCSCECLPGFGGTSCERDFCQLQRNTCNGNVSPINNGCECVCRAGYTGSDCREPLCDNYRDCSGNGNAFYDINQRVCRCQCQTEFTGSRCETRVPVCQPCRNGGSRSATSTYDCRCTCPNGYSGEYCEVDECQAVQSYCRNGRLVRLPGQCRCECNAGITGARCDTCISSCVNGGTAYINNDGVCDCSCRNGFGGSDCSRVLCDNVNCDQGRVSLINDRCTCVCNPGYTGTSCSEKACDDIRDCSNNGRSYFITNNSTCGCSCNQGFLPPDCSRRDCSRYRCANGGTQVTSGLSCSCNCPSTHTGPNCDTPVCAPCQNGGFNPSPNTGCTCQCRNGFSGSNCEIDQCRIMQLSGSCENGRTFPTPGGCNCACNTGITGANCDTCIRRCQNGGTAYISGGSCLCRCPAGYSGENCEIEPRCLRETCSGRGQSRLFNDRCVCDCNPGFTGSDCQSNVCTASDCNFRGSAYFDQITGQCACNCNAGFLAPNCENRDCSGYTCQNGGQAASGTTGCYCRCPATFSGTRCEIKDCSNSISCQNGGIAVAQGINCVCNCPQNFIGTRCETRDCSRYSCNNGGIAYADGTSCACRCAAGYMGSRCETRDCRSTICRNGGTITTIGNRCGCQCPTGFTGSQCETRECFNYGCRNGGIPAVSGSSCYCQCGADYTGQFCDTPTCLNYQCDNGGTPMSTGSSCVCRCPSFYTGSRCESRVCNSLTYSCENGGTPVPSGDSCACICTTGFSGPTCGRFLCTNTCLNGGTPRTTATGCGCDCTSDFTGERCEVNQCSSYCVNGQPTTTFSRGCGCMCSAGFSGPQCNQRDPCFGVTCLNGDQISVGNTCQCQCRAGFTGPDCSTPLCTRSNCNDHGASVYNSITGACECFCDAGFTGPTCAEITPCRTDCINGVGRINGPGQCFCSCQPGFTGTLCETAITSEQCTGAENRCQNGQPSIRNTCTGECQCACGEDYAGAYCEIRIEGDICNDCHWQNGVGFTYVKDRCDIFVTCIKNVDGGFLKVTSNCAPGTFWDMEALTCVAVGSGMCSEDPCQRLQPYANYSHGSQCQEFYTCGSDGRTTGTGCCEAGWGFNPQRQQCEPDSSCKGVCKRSPLDTRAASCYTGCEFAVNATDNHWFYSKQNPDDRRMCGPSTVFNESLCICDHDLSPPSRQLGCDPDRFLHFDNGVFQPEFTYDNVTLLGASSVGGIANGAGRFDGNDRVLIQRFANSGFHYNYFIIQVRVKPDNILPGQEFAVVSNGDCGVNESVSITLTPGQVHFKVQPEDSSPSILSANTNFDANGWVELELHYIKNGSGGYTFFGVVDGSESNRVYLPAPIDSRKCAIQVGQGYGYQLLQGFVDWVRIYTVCDPNVQNQG